MYRAQPKASKLLSAKWQEKEHQIHLAKLQNIKSAIKVDKPSVYIHLKAKQKKNQMLEGKYLAPPINGIPLTTWESFLEKLFPSNRNCPLPICREIH